MAYGYSFAINHDFRYVPGPMLESIAAWRRREKVELRIPVPEGFAPAGTIHWLQGPNRQPLPTQRTTQTLTTTLPTLTQAELLLIEAQE